MSNDYLTIGSVPYDEPCVQTGACANYGVLQRIECKAFILAIEKKIGEAPAGARLTVKTFPHDFGSYAEVVCIFDTNDEAAADYAFRCEAEAPATWAEVGMTAPVDTVSLCVLEKPEQLEQQ